MTATQWIVAASLATVAVSALAIFAGLKSVRDQMRVTVFLEYTERYAKIMQEMPYQAREPGSHYQLASQSSEERRRVLAVFREYLNLCSEEKWLHDQKRIDRPTWNIWECGMQDVARFPSFREAWSVLEPEYSGYKDFQNFVKTSLLVASGVVQDDAVSASQTDSPHAM
jgi:hypothetical protein